MVLFVGSLFARRHIPELVQAVALASSRVPDIRLVLVGDDRAQPPVDPVNLARQHGVADRVEWHAYVPDSALDALYARARVFAFLSEYEGFGMTPLEAAAAGVPPVVLDTAVAREVLADGARFVSLDPQSIAAALVELLTDDDAHARLAAAASRRLDTYSWTQSATTIRHALERAAARTS
jgi:alpha-1,3-rhamnosyl/mannosyltransferase